MVQELDYQKKVYGDCEARVGVLSSVGSIHLENVLAALKTTKGKVLDVGCGAGGMTKAIKFYRPDLELFGIDISEKAIVEARKDPRKVNFEVASAYHLPYKKDFFDAVAMFDVLEHLDSPDKALVEVNRVLKKRGVFFISIPVEKSLLTFTGLIEKLFKVQITKIPLGHIKQFTLPEIIKILKIHGFTIRRVKFAGFFLYQFVLALYIFWLKVSGQEILEVRKSLESKKFLARLPLDKFYGLIVFLSNLESKLLGKFPGYYTLIACQKL